MSEAINDITVKDIITLTEKVTVCATQYMSMNSDMKELKEDLRTGNKALHDAFKSSNELMKAELKESLCAFKQELDGHDSRITSLESARGKRFERVAELVYKLILTGFLGFIGKVILDYVTQKGGG